MRTIIFLLVAFASASAMAQTSLDKAVFEEINLARTDPKRYAVILKEARKHYSGKKLSLQGRIFETVEGTAAVNEAITFLNSQNPLPPLEWSDFLRKAAADHVNDQGPTKSTGHSGTDRSTTKKRIERYATWSGSIGENINYSFTDPRWVVIQLIVDDGVPARGHRKNIFSFTFKKAGVACGPHAGFGSMCVIDFAQDVTKK